MRERIVYRHPKGRFEVRESTGQGALGGTYCIREAFLTPEKDEREADGRGQAGGSTGCAAAGTAHRANREPDEPEGAAKNLHHVAAGVQHSSDCAGSRPGRKYSECIFGAQRAAGEE